MTAQLDIGLAFTTAARPYQPRPLWRFAEEEVICPPTSRYKDQPFRCSRQPFTRVLFDQLDNPHWQTHVITGPSQSSKTFAAFSIPLLFTIFELREDCGLATPEEDMANDKWTKELEPVIDCSPSFRRYKPTVGSGSRGGVIRNSLQFGNGQTIKLFSRGGQDTNKAGYPLRIMKVTEAAGWSQPGQNSKEGGPLRQLYARLRGHERKDRRMTIEGTLTDEWSLPWTLKGEDNDALLSSESRLMKPCPHCGSWVDPQRENLKGWQDAETEDQAANGAYWECPANGCTITDDDRKQMNADVRIVHHGQEIKPDGEITGVLPPVSTLWFHWHAFDNCYINTTVDCGVAEWQARQLPDETLERDNAEKELCQFGHSLPYKPRLENRVDLKRDEVKRRWVEWEQNVLPPDTTHLTMAADLGKYFIWWLVLGFRSCREFYVVNYGKTPVVENSSQSVKVRLKEALRDLFDTTAERGFIVDGQTERKEIDRVWADGGFWPDELAEVIREYHDPNLLLTKQKYRLCRGRGRSQIEQTRRSWRMPTKLSQRVVQIGRQWYGAVNHERRLVEIAFNADSWKLAAQDALAVDVGKPGAMAFYRPEDAAGHTLLATHVTNEKFISEIIPGKGEQKRWKRHGNQHLLDDLAMAMCAGDQAGFEFEA